MSDTRSDFVPFAVAGVYLSALGGFRLYEVMSLPADVAPAQGYPWWLLVYLQLLSAAILCCGVACSAAALAVWRRSPAARLLGVVGGVTALAFTAAHAWFLLFYERAFADGGLIFGVVHLLTLTRIDTTATSAGVAGYRVGQAVGILIWLGGAALLLALSRSLGPARSDGSSR